MPTKFNALKLARTRSSPFYPGRTPQSTKSFTPRFSMTCDRAARSSGSSSRTLSRTAGCDDVIVIQRPLQLTAIRSGRRWKKRV